MMSRNQRMTIAVLQTVGAGLLAREMGFSFSYSNDLWDFARFLLWFFLAFGLFYGEIYLLERVWR